MKANAPEKIYIFEEDLQREDHIVMYGINQNKDIRGLVEYTRTDAFIEKACEYMRSHIDQQLTIYHEQTWKKRDEFIEDFRKYMEE